MASGHRRSRHRRLQTLLRHYDEGKADIHVRGRLSGVWARQHKNCTQHANGQHIQHNNDHNKRPAKGPNREETVKTDTEVGTASRERNTVQKRTTVELNTAQQKVNGRLGGQGWETEWDPAMARALRIATVALPSSISTPFTQTRGKTHRK